MARFQKALLCALLIAPAAAVAGQEGGSSFVDVFFVPKTDFEFEVPGFDFEDDGDGFGIRGLIRAGEVVILTGEFQTVDYDESEIDRDDIRFGLGAAGPTGSGGYIEYVSSELEDLDWDGFGLHGRLAGPVSPQVQLYGDLGYLVLEDEDGDDLGGFEFTLGAAIAFTPGFGGFVDYRRTSLDYDDFDVELDFADFRIGGRLLFGG